MSRHERTGLRDLTYSTWHRYAVHSPKATWIDVDAVEYCCFCREPLIVFELSRDIGRRKDVSLMPLLATRLKLSGGVVLYTPSGTECACGKDFVDDDCDHGISKFRVEWMVPTHYEVEYTAEHFAEGLLLLHERHKCPRR